MWLASTLYLTLDESSAVGRIEMFDSSQRRQWPSIPEPISYSRKVSERLSIISCLAIALRGRGGGLRLVRDMGVSSPAVASASS